MIVRIQCTDAVGLVATITSAFANRQLNIISLREHVELSEGQFFMRLHADACEDVEGLERELKAVLPADAVVAVSPVPAKRIVVLVTREYHCLGDILLRHHFNTLGAKVVAVIGNHDHLRDLCHKFDVPFILVSHEGRSKESFEAAIENELATHEHDYIVLAKFMRILSPAFVAKRPMGIINIHHSFLPAFAGASPYRQAYTRGVKLIGATAHMVTDDLDEGPIIAQQIIPVNHAHTVEDMVTAGKEIEKAVLAKAMKLVFEDRVFVFNNKTVVFE
jgi:formyltetrahydrofolate deformylase